MKPGIFLKSTFLLDNTFFEGAVIFITEYNEKGAMGFVINKKFPRTLNELEEFKNLIPFPLYAGGPVDQEHLYFVHQRPDLIGEGTQVTDNIFLGGNLKAVVSNTTHNTLTEKDIKMFIGYCGWDFHELEEEIAEGSWEILGEAAVF